MPECFECLRWRVINGNFCHRLPNINIYSIVSYWITIDWYNIQIYIYILHVEIGKIGKWVLSKMINKYSELTLIWYIMLIIWCNFLLLSENVHFLFSIVFGVCLLFNLFFFLLFCKYFLYNQLVYWNSIIIINHVQLHSSSPILSIAHSCFISSMPSWLV